MVPPLQKSCERTRNAGSCCGEQLMRFGQAFRGECGAARALTFCAAGPWRGPADLFKNKARRRAAGIPLPGRGCHQASRSRRAHGVLRSAPVWKGKFQCRNQCLAKQATPAPSRPRSAGTEKRSLRWTMGNAIGPASDLIARATPRASLMARRRRMVLCQIAPFRMVQGLTGR